MITTDTIVIEIYPNGDPFGNGYQGSQSNDGGKSWFFRGDVSPQSLEDWRTEAKRIGAVLQRER